VEAGPPRLILFDIDQTLISSAGAGVRALNSAFQQEIGISNALEGIRCDGKLDTAIIKEVLERQGDVAHPELAHSVLGRYLECLSVEMDQTREGHIKPGIRTLLDLLHQSGSSLGLLTGNVRQGALIKLRHFALDSYFPIGAFGDDAEERWQLVPIAKARAEKHYRASFPPNLVFVIGDSPRDIECCRPSGAVSIAVATGSSPLETLATFQPDYLFPDCSEVECIFQTIMAHGD